MNFDFISYSVLGIIFIMIIVFMLTIVSKIRFNSSKPLKKSDSEPFSPDPLSKKPKEVEPEPENAWDYLDEKIKKKDK